MNFHANIDLIFVFTEDAYYAQVFAICFEYRRCIKYFTPIMQFQIDRW